LVRNLTLLEWKYAWRWEPRTYTIKLGDKVAYLYNDDGKLLTSYPYVLKGDNLDMEEFAVHSIKRFTKLPLDMIREKYKPLYKSKKKLWEIFRVPIDVPKRFTSSWIRVRKNITFKATPKPNQLGFYYAEIDVKIGKENLMLINDNVLELLRDLFFLMECYIGHEELPYTFSQAWYMNYKIYGDRRYGDSVARYNIEQVYYNYIFDKIVEVFGQDKEDAKASGIHIMELFRKLKENKYYMMELILNDPHFEITEDDFVCYYPITELKEII